VTKITEQAPWASPPTACQPQLPGNPSFWNLHRSFP